MRHHWANWGSWIYLNSNQHHPNRISLDLLFSCQILKALKVHTNRTHTHAVHEHFVWLGVIFTRYALLVRISCFFLMLSNIHFHVDKCFFQVECFCILLSYMVVQCKLVRFEKICFSFCVWNKTNLQNREKRRRNRSRNIFMYNEYDVAIMLGLMLGYRKCLYDINLCKVNEWIE